MLVRENGVGTGISIAGRNITERKQLERQVLDIANRERQSIGRDLHDGLGQELTGVALMLRGLATKIQKACPDAIDSVNEIVGLVNQSIESARSLAKGLLPVSSERGGLADALSALANRSRDLYGLEVRFRADVWPDTVINETVASHLYRIAQEALTNAERHGLASHVDIQLTVTRNTLLLRIADDGEGIGNPTGRTTGMGLKIMEYRAGIIGARLEIVANEPRGTVVTVTGEHPATLAQVQLQHGN
jgi:signal transduction histidine kinase